MPDPKTPTKKTTPADDSSATLVTEETPKNPTDGQKDASGDEAPTRAADQPADTAGPAEPADKKPGTVEKPTPAQTAVAVAGPAELATPPVADSPKLTPTQKAGPEKPVPTDVLQDLDNRIAQTKKQIELAELEATLAKKEQGKARAATDEKTGAVDAKLKYKTKQREAIKALLDATKGNIPELFREVNKELKAVMQADKGLELDDSLLFEKNAHLRVPALPESLDLKNSSDFFTLSPQDQLNLYDRIGLFKGIVVDYDKDVPVQQGYRDVIRFVEPDKPDEKTKNVRVFYRKPRLSGYVESTYAFDEDQTKTQQSGIFNLGASLSAAYSGWGFSATVQAGYTQGKDRHEEAVTHTQKVSVTSNFFLPKIELSLDTLHPAAAPDFEAAVRQALNGPTEVQFAQLNRVLREFGHFVSTSLVIGGRLYATDTKTIDQSSSVENELSKSAIKFQAALETWSLDVGLNVETSTEEARKKAEKHRHEKQALQLHAVGGDGVYINDTARWVQSLANYSGWSLVKFDNLVPSLRLLPPTLHQLCHELLSEIVSDPGASIEGLKAQQAHYLFYQGYLELYGHRVAPRYFVLKGVDTDNRVLTVAAGHKVNDADVQLAPYEEETHQQWWMTPDGRLRCRSEQDETESYVLALNNGKLVVNQEGYFENQHWKLAGGMFKNLGTNKYLVIKDKETLEVCEESGAKSSRNVWQALLGEQLNKLRKAKPKKAATPMKGEAFNRLHNGHYLTVDQTLVSPDGNVVLRLQGNELVIEVEEIPGHPVPLYQKQFAKPISRLSFENGRMEVVLDDQERIALATDTITSGHSLELLNCGNLELIGRDDEVIWESGAMLYSTIRSSGNDGVLTIYHVEELPTAETPSNKLTILPFVGADHQLWYVNRKNQIISKLTRENGQKLALTDQPDGPLVLMPLIQKEKTQQWILDEKGVNSILNLHTNRYLSSADNSRNGRTMRTTALSGTNWEVKRQSLAVSAAENRLMLHVAPSIHDENVVNGYLNFDKSFNDQIDLDVFGLDNRELRGLRITSYDRLHADQPNAFRFAIQAIVLDTNGGLVEVESPHWGKNRKSASFSKENFWLDKSPVYLGAPAEKIGLRMKGDGFALTASAAGKIFKNEEETQSIGLKRGDIHFVDMTAVVAPVDERIVGFGFTRHTQNRVGLYLLTLKKTSPQTSQK